MLRVLIADDHPVFRRGLKQIIDDTFDMSVAGEATDGLEALRKATTCDYDVVLLDISMPLKNGLDVLSRLKAERPALPVLMLSMHPEEQYAVRALKTGASGYLTKESAPEEMLSAIRKVSKGGKYVSASLAETLASMLNNDGERLPHEALSNREYQVMLLIASGKSVSEIAQVLSISVKTVSTYRARILEKLGMTNNAEIIRYATKNELVE
jgi:two-component system, NarL family, invasion response regulator UvrY